MKRWIGIFVGLMAVLPAGAAEVVAIAPGIDLIPGVFAPNTQPDGNSILFHAPDGLVLVDTGRHPAHTQRLIDYAKAANVPIAAIVNSHWHLDHISGNPRMRAAYPDVKIYASNAIDGAMHGFLADYRKQLEDAVSTSKDPAQTAAWQAEIATIDTGRALYPDIEVARTEKRRIAGQDFVVHLESPAATAGDVWLFEPKSRVLVSGDLVTLPVPFLDTACPGQWKVALDHIAQADFTTLVPGHGAPMRRTQFETYRKAYGNLLACAASSAAKQTCIDGWLADAKPLLAESDTRAAKGMLDYYLDNALRGPKANLDKLCGVKSRRPG